MNNRRKFNIKINYSISIRLIHNITGYVIDYVIINIYNIIYL